MSEHAAKTPPAHVRTVTHEELARDIKVLQRHDSEAYAALRDLAAKVDKNHLVTMDALGELARMLGERKR